MAAENRRHPVGFAEIFATERGIDRLRLEAAQGLIDESARRWRAHVCC
jgi:hypothetical protein